MTPQSTYTDTATDPQNYDAVWPPRVELIYRWDGLDGKFSAA
jgi:hypothetical protein